MNCPRCDAKTKVIDTVFNSGHNEVYRRRQCVKCGYMYYTTENIANVTGDFLDNWNRHHRRYDPYRVKTIKQKTTERGKKLYERMANLSVGITQLREEDN